MVLADPAEKLAFVLELHGEALFPRSGIQTGFAVEIDPLSSLPLPAVMAGPTGRTSRTGAESMRELHPSLGQGIEIWRLQDRVPHTALLCYSMIGTEDVYDVGAFHDHSQSLIVAMYTNTFCAHVLLGFPLCIINLIN